MSISKSIRPDCAAELSSASIPSHSGGFPAGKTPTPSNHGVSTNSAPVEEPRETQVAKAGGSIAPDHREAIHGTRPIGLLVVEDDALLLKSLGQGFRNRGFDLWTALNGAEAIDVYQQFGPLIDIVLSDVQMPVLDGPSTLAALQTFDPTVRVCFMTGDPRDSMRSELLQLGALRVFEKPLPSVGALAFELWELASALREAAFDVQPPVAVDDCRHVAAGEPCHSDTPERERSDAWAASPMARISQLLHKVCGVRLSRPSR